MYDTRLTPWHTETTLINWEPCDSINTPDTPRSWYSDRVYWDDAHHPLLAFDWEAPLARYIESGKIKVPQNLEEYFLKIV